MPRTDEKSAHREPVRQQVESASRVDFAIAHFPEADPKTYASQALLYHAQGKRSAEERVLAKGRRIFPEDGLLRQMSESVNRAATP